MPSSAAIRPAAVSKTSLVARSSRHVPGKRGWLMFGALAILAAAATAYFGRGWSFFYDEWGVIFYRRGGGLPAFAAPLNGHLVAVTVGVYRVLFATVGLRSYTPYRWVTIAAHVLLIALVFAYV